MGFFNLALYNLFFSFSTSNNSWCNPRVSNGIIIHSYCFQREVFVDQFAHRCRKMCVPHIWIIVVVMFDQSNMANSFINCSSSLAVNKRFLTFLWNFLYVALHCNMNTGRWSVISVYKLPERMSSAIS